MNRNRGVVSGPLIAIIAVVVILVLIIGIGVTSYVSAFNYGNSIENQLIAVQTDNKNKLAQYGQKVLEVAQVPDMYKSDMIAITQAAIQGRYGADGSKATFQMLKEQNPTLDGSMYKQIQQVIEAGRNDFQAGQTRQVDVRRQYETALGSFWTGMWMRMAGYPKVNLKDFDIVSTDRADTAFKEHKETGPIKLR
jgi:uncharacterized protein (UPF0333 family)